VTRIQTPDLLPEEDELDRSLRPRTLADFVGQEPLRDQLAVSLEAAAARGEALDHVLLAGPPGLGKTSLAQILAGELGVPFVATAAPALERKGDIAALLTALEPRSIFFVDEIHRLSRALEETFYPAMEDRRLPITVGQGAGAKVVTLELPPFTLVGATTRAGRLTTPLRDRFGIQHRLEPYGARDLAAIVRRSAAILDVELAAGGAEAIAARSRGTPRVANRLLKRVRDFAQVRADGVVSEDVARAALDLLQVDHLGLDRLDREILAAVCLKFDGGPVGLGTLGVTVGEETDTLEDVYEPYLLQCGLLKRTPRGRVATSRAYAHLGLEPPAEPQLF
jgi:Holliday junction DNA helicase RuvB